MDRRCLNHLDDEKAVMFVIGLDMSSRTLFKSLASAFYVNRTQKAQKGLGLGLESV